MPHEENKQNKWVYTEVDEDTHRTLCERSTELGLHPKVVVARYIEEGLAKDAAGSTLIDVEIYKADYETRQAERWKVQVHQIAQRVAESGDQKHYDILAGLCEQIGITVDKAMENVSSFREPLVTTYDNGHGVASAMMWLNGRFDSQEEFASNAIMAMGSSQGFSQSVLNEAKRKLGIVSVRKPTYWTWQRGTNGNGNGREEEGR